MSGWRRICCAVDFSERSRIAMLEAAELARGSGAELRLVHVFPPPQPTALAVEMITPLPDDVAQRLAEEREQHMASWCDEAGRVSGGRVEGALEQGEAAEGVTRFARETAADLIVIATHGRTGLARVVLGSVAERVVREASCSVLVVRRAPP